MSKATATEPTLLSTSSLSGNDVRNAKGENLGDVKDMMVDVSTGRVAYAVLSFGGILGMGDKLFAIPWEALQLDPREECFVLNVPKEKLDNAPGFNKDNWPNMADRRWGTDIHSHYGYRPFWE